jgi:hypothetical protein
MKRKSTTTYTCIIKFELLDKRKKGELLCITSLGFSTKGIKKKEKKKLEDINATRYTKKKGYGD